MAKLQDIVELSQALQTEHVLVYQKRCLGVRNRHSSCTKCVDACLTNAIIFCLLRSMSCSDKELLTSNMMQLSYPLVQLALCNENARFGLVGLILSANRRTDCLIVSKFEFCFFFSISLFFSLNSSDKGTALFIE